MSEEISQRHESLVFPIIHPVDRLWCSSKAREFAEKVGLGPKSISEIEIIVSELVSNVLEYAESGKLILERINSPAPGMKIIVEDKGKGIEDTDLAISDGYSEGRLVASEIFSKGRKGLGFGLGSVRRLSDDFRIQSIIDVGTTVIVCKYVSRSNRG